MTQSNKPDAANARWHLGCPMSPLAFGKHTSRAMKNHLAVLLTLAAAFTVGLGSKTPTKDQCRVSLSPIFMSDDEQVWRLTIETRDPTQYRLVSSGSWGSGELSGDTAKIKPGRRACEAKVWLLISQITPSSGELSYVKTILQGDGETVTQTRELPKDTRPNSTISTSAAGDARIHPMNTPVAIGRINGQVIQLMVGTAARQWKAEQRATPNAAPPRR